MLPYYQLIIPPEAATEDDLPWLQLFLIYLGIKYHKGSSFPWSEHSLAAGGRPHPPEPKEKKKAKAKQIISQAKRNYGHALTYQ